jgi:hypothetical protein
MIEIVFAASFPGEIPCFFGTTWWRWIRGVVVTTYNTHYQGVNMLWEPWICEQTMGGFLGSRPKCRWALDKEQVRLHDTGQYV